MGTKTYPAPSVSHGETQNGAWNGSAHLLFRYLLEVQVKSK